MLVLKASFVLSPNSSLSDHFFIFSLSAISASLLMFTKIYAKRTAKVMLFLFLTKIFKKKFLLPNLKYLIFLHARLMVISFYFHNRRRFNPSHHFLLLILSLSISRKRVQKYSFFIYIPNVFYKIIYYKIGQGG